jgi:hypothetical protein
MKKVGGAIVIGMLLAGTPSFPDEHAPTDCQKVLDRLAWLEESTRQSIVGLEHVRREAQRLSEWFGAESFEAYIAAMRRQEATLRGQLEELRQARCPE